MINPSTKTGGTLRLLAGADCDSWDPARTSLHWCWNLQRLINRTLVTYSKVNGIQFKLAPDLATAPGDHNADYTEWTYTLQHGLHYADGRPIRPVDVKYGIERLFDHDLVPGDARSELVNAIAHPRSYAGPHKSGDLPTIATTSDSITFHLAHPMPDFDNVLAMPASAPVPYHGRPVASGPYQIKSHRRDVSVVFVRNPHWLQQTDVVRHPLVDKVRLRVEPDLKRIDRQLRAGRADARADGGVQSRFGTHIIASPELTQEADDPFPAGVTRYLAVLPSAIPNIHCRRAVFYAVDKQAAVRAFGGGTGAAPARSLTPPGVPGFDPDYNPYPSGPVASGNLHKAKQELIACGKPDGFTTRFAYGTPSETGPKLFLAEQQALNRVGIRVTTGPGLPSDFYCQNASPQMLRRQHIGLLATTLRAAYPTGYGLYRPDHNRFPCLEDEDTDLTRLHLPVVDRVLHAAIRDRATSDDWTALDRAVMSSATYLPLVWPKTLYYRNPRMMNVTCDNALASGIYDFVNVGVR